MSEITKQALKVENNQSFPNNNAGLITPSALRTFNEDMIDSLVGQIQYTADSGSWNQQINALEEFTASASGLTTGSLLTTASFNDGTRNLTFTKGDGSTFAVNIPDVSGSIIDTGSFVTNIQNNILTPLTLLYDTADGSGFNVTLDLPSGVVSGSEQVVGILSSVNAFTQSQETKNTTLGSVTASLQQQLTNIGSQSGSWVTESETGSFARTNVTNTFTQDQIIQGTLTAYTMSADTLNVRVLHTTIESSSVIFSSGSNVLGDASNDVQTLNGSVRVVNELTASGLNYPNADNGAKSFIQTDGNGNLSLQYVDTIWESFYAGESVPKGTPLYFSGSQGANPIAYAADAANPNKMPVVLIAGENITAGSTYEGIVLGLIEGLDLTGYTAGQTVYVAEGGGWSTSLPSGSNSITQVLGIVTKGGNGGKGLVLNPGPAQLPGLQTGYAWVGNGNNRAIAVPTSSFAENTDLGPLNAFTASQELINSGVNTFTQSADSRLDNLELFTSSQETLNTQLLNASSSFEEKFNTIGTQSGSWGGGTIDTGSFATTGSNTFTGDQTLTDAAGNTITLSDASGSLMLVAKTFTSASAHLTASAGNQVNLIFKNNNNTTDTTISGSNNIFTNPTTPTADYKRIVGSNNIVNSATGMPQVTGSMTTPITMASNYFGSGTTTVRGPITGSLFTISNNAIFGTANLGQVGVNDLTRVSAFTFTGNQVIGTMTFAASTNAALPTLASTPSVTNNIVNGAMQATMNSSSLAFSNNIVNAGSFIVANNHFTTAAGTGQLSVNNNIVGGLQFTNLTVQGANPVGTNNNPAFSGNLSYGISNAAHINADLARVSGTNAYISLNATAILGANLAVTGSSLGSDTTSFGSAFVGRFNANDGIRNKTSDIVFAVGTGTATGTRKTGLLVDSGSNTFVEGSLNVSGSSVFTGSLVLSSSAAVELQVIGETQFTGSVGITGTLTASLQEGYVWVGNSSGRTTTVSTSSFGGGGSDLTSLNAFTASQELLNTTFATTGSNTFNGTQTISGSILQSNGNSDFAGNLNVQSNLNVGLVLSATSSTALFRDINMDDPGAVTSFLQNPNYFSEFTGNVLRWRENVSSGSFIMGEEEIEVLYNGWSSSYDNALYTNVGRVGVEFSDWDNAYNRTPWLRIGRQERPSFQRGLEITGSTEVQDFTASLQQGYVWVGDVNGRTITVSTGSFGGGGSAFPYSGTASISGALQVTGSMSGFVNTLAVTSQTASVNFNDGNMFVITLPTGSVTHITPTNIKTGQTINIQISQAASATTGSVTFSPNVLFAGGADYQATATGSAIDLLTLVSLDGTNVLAASIRNFQ